MNVNYTPTRYEALQLATTKCYRIVRRATGRVGGLARYRVLRVLFDSNHRPLDAGPAGNGEARAVLDLWRGGLLSTVTAADDVEAEAVVTRTGHRRLAEWTQRWQRQRQRAESEEREVG